MNDFTFYLINDNNHDNHDNDTEINYLLTTNKDLLLKTNKIKDKINEYHENKIWDKNKKLLYKYENITNYNKYPVSRGFYKFQEIMLDFNFLFPKEKIKVLFLSESPGGFYQSFIFNRHKINIYDEIYGFSLKEKNLNDRATPTWRIPFNIKKYIKIYYGIDDTGNIYNIDNIKFLVSKLKKNDVDFISADGGFDFNNNYNNQESSSIKLKVCEILTALLLQKQNGVFLIKLFDIFGDTIKLVHLLYKYYEKIIIIKQLSSRPYNSEKYLLCSGFKNNVSSTDIEYIINCIKTENFSFENTPYSLNLLKQITEYNIKFSNNQINNIQSVLDLINNNIKYENIDESKIWLEKYYS